MAQRHHHHLLNRSGGTSHRRARGVLPLLLALIVAILAAPGVALAADEGGHSDMWLPLIPTVVLSCVGAWVTWRAQHSTTSRDQAIDQLQESVADIRERYVRREELAQLEARMQAAIGHLRRDLDERLDRLDARSEQTRDAVASLREDMATLRGDMTSVLRLLNGARV